MDICRKCGDKDKLTLYQNYVRIVHNVRYIYRVYMFWNLALLAFSGGWLSFY
jgi:hypothetical protein